MRRRDVVAAFGLAAIARPGLSQPTAGSARQEAATPLIGFVHGSAPVGQYKLFVAVFRLITSSNRVGSITGNSAGLAPLSTLPA